MMKFVVPSDCRSLVERWKLVAKEYGDQVAISSPGASYTYSTADRVSDAVATKLFDVVQSDQNPVAVFVGHTAEGVIGLLSVLKAGRIAVFLDPHLPADRLRNIVELAGATVCLVDEANAPAVPHLGGRLTRVMELSSLIAEVDLSAADAAGLPEVPPGVTLPSGPEAAVIVFTSGSTGGPKGVVQTHDQLLNEVFANGERFRISPADRVALVLPYGFAAGLSLLFVGLLNGAGVWSLDPREGGTRRLVDWIQDRRLTTLHCTPHLLRSLIAVMDEEVVLSSLRLVSTVGEAVHGRDVAGIRPHLTSDASFFNWTGSSEMGTLSLHEIAGGHPLPAGTVPAGRPIANKEVEIRRDDGTLALAGESGEIVAISDYLSGGYWRDDAGNAARFRVHPDGRRACHQGDLARFDERHDLVLLGRSDAAIKVRGYLVEPSEIEAALLAEPEVQDAVVVAVVAPPDPTRLVAYVVPDGGLRTQSPAALRRRLRQRLPEYMVPSDIVNTAALPRNERGKVDRARLPSAPRLSLAAPPTSQWELVVADLWSDVLGLHQIGLDDDFMALGGDSLSVEEMLVSVQERFGVSLVSSDLIQAPTLREFTRRVTLGSSSLPSHPDVVSLRSGGGRTPLFCFAGSGALALTFLPLSRHLRDRPVYAFQAHGLERRAVPDWSVNASARRFLEILRVIQPRGPYLLVGHSFGGLVALEIAKMLVDGGETVELVTLLDTYLPRSAGQQPTFTYETLPQPSAEPFREGRRTDLVRRQVQRVLPDGLPVVSDWARHARSYVAGLIPFSGQRQFDAFFDHGTLVSRRYQVTPYEGRSLLVLADENPDGPAAWAPLLTGSFEFVDLPSEHSSLLRDPHALKLAEIIETELARIDR